MSDLCNRLLSSVLPCLLAASALAQTEQPSSPVPALAPEEVQHALYTDVMTVPTPGEVFAAIDKGGKPNWSSQYRPPTSFNSTSRAQVALNLGTLIADGFIAVAAKDGQQVKNIGRDVLTLAKKLSVSDSVLARSKSITQFAENGAWPQLDEELAATQNEVKQALEQNRDADLITLVSVGGWIRGTEVVTGLLLQNYNADDAKLLRQPALVAYLRSKLDQVNPKLRDDKAVGKVSQQLEAVEKMVSFPADHVPSAEEVRSLNGLVANIAKQISNIQ
ncbi:MAG: hypothetical protein JO015_17705 [Verrucomicrobia bacterium]|nr:hypothetical protein [Verrucomicrobiota bacterium]